VSETAAQSSVPAATLSPLIAGIGSYRVYKTPVEFTTVTAASALEALKTSGVPAAYKVERHWLDSDNVIDAAQAQALLGDKAALPADAQATAAAPEPPKS
jgi:hypothetical protein